MNIGQLMLHGYPEIDSGAIADAGGNDVKIMDYAIRPVHHSMKLAGPVYTVEQPGGTNFPILQAIEKAPAGSVLIVNSQSSMQAGQFGDLMASACLSRGIVGLIIDGSVRDVPDLIRMNFPVFARGSTPRGNATYEGTLNQPIQCGGILVNPDDIVFADATGIVVFPKIKAEAIYKQAIVITTTEMGIHQQMMEGKGLLEIPAFKERGGKKK